jgi:transposase
MTRVSSEQWRIRVSAWLSSGQTAGQYGRQQGIDARQLRSWKWKLGREDRLRGEARPAFVPAHIESEASPKAFRGVELTFSSGVIVRIPAGFSPSALAALIESVGSLAC